MADDERRAAAEARRQRILARGKDRLSQITSGAPAQASSQAQEASLPDLPDASPALPSQVLPPVEAPTTESAVPASVPTAPISLATHSCSSEHVGLRQRTTATPPSPAPSPNLSTRLAATSAPDPSAHQPPQAATPTRTEPADMPQTDTTAPLAAGLFDSSPQPATQQPMSGVVLHHAVLSTALLRCMLAMSMAYALFNGYATPVQLRLPPVVQLLILQVMVVACGCVWNCMPSRSAALRAKAAEDAKLARFQGFNPLRMITAMFPGLSSGMSTLQAASEAATSFMDVTAVYVVCLVVMQASLNL